MLVLWTVQSSRKRIVQLVMTPDQSPLLFRRSSCAVFAPVREICILQMCGVVTRQEEAI